MIPTMESKNERAERDLPGLRDFCSELISLGRGMSRFPVPFELGSPNGISDFNLMASVYLERQCDHLDSILTLAHRDVGLIARTMLEGMAQFLWASRDREGRAKSWRFFVYVHDWRLLEDRKRRRIPTPPEAEDQVWRGLLKWGRMFVSEKKKNRPLEELLTDGRDPFFSNWTGKQVKELFSEISGNWLYEYNYDFFSDYNHWGISGFEHALGRDHTRFFYGKTKAVELALSLATGFQCLYQVLWVAEEYFKSGVAVNLLDVRDRFLRFGGVDPASG